MDGVHNGQAGCGKLLLTTDAPPAILKSLRCVQVGEAQKSAALYSSFEYSYVWR